MPEPRVTARSRRDETGNVSTVYHVDGVPVEDTDAVETLLGA